MLSEAPAEDAAPTPAAAEEEEEGGVGSSGVAPPAAWDACKCVTDCAAIAAAAPLPTGAEGVRGGCAPAPPPPDKGEGPAAPNTAPTLEDAALLASMGLEAPK